jgi:hypothetical protein
MGAASAHGEYVQPYLAHRVLPLEIRARVAPAGNEFEVPGPERSGWGRPAGSGQSGRFALIRGVGCDAAETDLGQRVAAVETRGRASARLLGVVVPLGPAQDSQGDVRLSLVGHHSDQRAFRRGSRAARSCRRE